MLKCLKLLLLISLLLPACARTEKEHRRTLTWWQFWTDPQVRPVIAELTAQFEKENPNIKVEITDLTWSDGHEKIVVAFSSNTAPDILELGSDWVPEFSYEGVLADVTLEADKIKSDHLMWKPAIVNNVIFGFPWILDTRVLFYNKDLMKKAGLDPNHPPQTWNELLDACKKTNKFKPQFYGFGANAFERHRLYKKFLPFLWANNANILSDDFKTCVINSPEAKEALGFYKELCNSGIIDIQSRLDEMFAQGKIGFVISGGWLLKNIQANYSDLDFGVALIPKPSENKGIPASFAGGEFLVINDRSKNKQEALKFIEFLIQKENSLKLCQTIGSALPSAKGSYYQGNENLKIFQEQLNSAFSPPAHPKWVYMEEIIEKKIEQVMYDKKTPDQALDEAKEEIEHLLK
jgi:multiple sugar transport system substrate-binding protein